MPDPLPRVRHTLLCCKNGRMKVVRIDADTNPETVSRYAVLSMPTLLVFEGASR